MEKFLKDNIIYIVILVMAVAFGLFFTGKYVVDINTAYGELDAQKDALSTKQTELNNLKAQKAREQKQETKKVKNENAKVIYEVLGAQFTPEASFGIMFDSLLSNMTNSGIRIRSIDYNYSPQDDKIMQAGADGYNACELAFTTVANYAQLQNFLKNLAKEKYLTGINEIYIEPYEKDKTILIARFKIRLYTKTI